MTRSCDLLVIGGGVIGVCAAYYAADAGLSVTLVERGEICPPESAVYANAGLITPSDAHPLAGPGALGKGLRWMLDSGSPFYVAPWADPGLPRWLLLFKRYCTAEAEARGMRVQRQLVRWSADLHAELAAKIGEAAVYRQLGWLWAFETEEGLAEGRASAAAAAPLGVKSETVDAADLPGRAPGIGRGFAGGVYYPEDAHVDPARFVRELAGLAVARGATLLPGHEALRLETKAGRVTGVLTTRGLFTADTVVLAAGAWSPGLARQAGLRLPIQAAKGYGVTVPRPEGSTDVPLYLGEKSVCVTPMGDRLRLAGTLELAGFDLSVRWKRVQRIRDGAERLLPGTLALEADELWRGLRPCTPDGLPFIGRSPRHDNLIVASGHAMLGLGEGPATGRLVAQLAAGETPQIDLTPLRVDRFSGLLPSTPVA